MTSGKLAEHFVTLFDSHYLPQGLSLYRSLEQHGQPFHLWIVALDDACAEALARMQLGDATVIPLAEIESDALLSVKPLRSVAEYCWTLTPFLPSHVLARAPGAVRVTYVDADLFFFQSPALLIDEFVASGKHVLITEHAFAPEHSAKARFGRFCVQFMTFSNSEPARRVLSDWQRRCVEWCYAREEEGKFGDQKYLDAWPESFPSEVHILARTDRTVAPWNVAHLCRVAGEVRPAFYHFHGVKVVSRRTIVLYYMYRIGRPNRWIYDRYVASMRSVAAEMRRRGIPIVARPLFAGVPGRLRFFWAALTGRAAWARL